MKLKKPKNLLKIAFVFGVPVILALLLLDKTGKVKLPEIFDNRPSFNLVDPEQSAIDKLPANNPDESNLFSSPAGIVDDGIYYPSTYESAERSKEELIKISQDLPILISDYKTSVGLRTTTSIHIKTASKGDILTIKIIGVDYNQNEAVDSNPHYIAFKDSLNQAKTEIAKAGADPTKILYNFGNKEYIVNTANIWARVSEIL